MFTDADTVCDITQKMQLDVISSDQEVTTVPENDKAMFLLTILSVALPSPVVCSYCCFHAVKSSWPISKKKLEHSEFWECSPQELRARYPTTILNWLILQQLGINMPHWIWKQWFENSTSWFDIDCSYSPERISCQTKQTIGTDKIFANGRLSIRIMLRFRG